MGLGVYEYRIEVIIFSLKNWPGISNPPQEEGSTKRRLLKYIENNVYPCKPQFYYKNVGFEGVKII